jgi:hypothetical protein
MNIQRRKYLIMKINIYTGIDLHRSTRRFRAFLDSCLQIPDRFALTVTLLILESTFHRTGNNSYRYKKVKRKGKAVPVTGRGGP